MSHTPRRRAAAGLLRFARNDGLLIVSSFLFLLFSSPAVAQSAAELAQIEKEVSAQKESAAALEKKEKETASELEGLRQKLIDATEALQGKQGEQSDLEERLGSLEKETTLRALALAEQRGRLALLTSALLQQSRLPPGLFILHETSPDDAVHQTILLRSLLPFLKDETARLASEIAKFATLQERLATQKRLATTAEQNLQWQRHSLDELVKMRQGMLQKTTAEKEAIARQLEALTGEAKDLRQLMEKVSAPAWDRTVGKGKAAPPARPASLRAGIKMPVSGKIIRSYGSKDDFGVVSDGVTLVAAYGSPIIAPQTGKVVFVGPFRGYGNIVILQHAGGYHSFLSGFSRIDADMGQTVNAGEPLGVLASKGEGKPEVYFEWRKGTDPVDPTTGGGR